jgi:predicted transcriptional regulator
MTTLKVGISSLDQFQARTMAMVRGEYKARPDEPKVWFSSIESFAKILSEQNRDLLRVIAETEPRSLNELAEATGRAPSNLSRTLKTLERHGLVQFEKGEGRTLVPRTPYSAVVLDLPLQGRSKAAPNASEVRTGRELDDEVHAFAEEPQAVYVAGPQPRVRRAAGRAPARPQHRRPRQ